MEQRIDQILTDLVDGWADFLLNGKEGDGIAALKEAKDALLQLMENNNE